MRILKFRAWDKERKKFDYYIIPKMNGSWDINLLDKEITQFTGLTDKNGKEIYEGDIVVGIHYEDFDTGIGINTLSEECEPFEVKWDENVYGWNLYGSDDFRVIGNIYETPNLLN